MNNLNLQNPRSRSEDAFWRFEDKVCQLLNRLLASVRVDGLIDN